MKPKEYDVLHRAVEEGVAYGITRVFKYYDGTPLDEDGLRHQAHTIQDAVMNSICEWFTFNDEHDDA